MAAMPLGLVLSGLLVWHSSFAAFTATTINPSNNWSSGSVTLSDDDLNGAMFTVTGLKPGNTGTRCIRVTYGGTLTAPVKLYLDPDDLAGTLGPYLDLTVEEGSGGTYADCTGFTPSGTIYTGTLSGLSTTHSSYDGGTGSWTPTGAGQTRGYRITWTLQDENDAQDKSATATFTWEAQSS